jgi:hypothetical protein
MDAYELSGFRYATEDQVRRWYEDRDLPLPPRVPANQQESQPVQS